MAHRAATSPRRVRRALAAGLAAAALGAGSGCGPAAAPRPTGVVLFVIDTLRADALGAYGHPDSPSPTFDALAERGILFEQAYAPAPWTLPSTVSLFTSTMPCEHGVLVDGDRLPETAGTLAVRMREAGHATASFFANPYAGPVAGLDRGFDRAESVHFEEGDRVAAWLDTVGDRPFFLYVHNVEPHDPYPTQPPGMDPERRHLVNRLQHRYRALTRLDWSEGRPPGTTDNAAEQREALARLEANRDAVRSLYDAAVRVADRRLRGVVEALVDAGVWDRTLLVVTSDHGEAFGEHGGWQHDQSLYEELLRVPLLVRLPGDAHAGRRVERPVSLLDVVPTLADALEAPAVAEGSRGRSLLADLGGDGTPAGPRAVAFRVDRKKHHAVFESLRGDLNVAFRDGPWKAIWNAEPGTLELYDLERDPGEQADRSAAEAERARAFRLAGRAQAAACPDPDAAATAGAPEIDPDTRERLRGLGYVD